MVLAGSRYWSGLLEWMRENLLAPGRITASDLAQAELADGPEEIVERLWSGMVAAG